MSDICVWDRRNAYYTRVLMASQQALAAFGSLTENQKRVMARLARTVARTSTPFNIFEFFGAFFTRPNISTEIAARDFARFASLLEELDGLVTEIGIQTLAREIWTRRTLGIPTETSPEFDAARIVLYSLYGAKHARVSGMVPSGAIIMFEVRDATGESSRIIDVVVYLPSPDEAIDGPFRAVMSNILYRIEVKSGTKTRLDLDRAVIDRLSKDFREIIQHLVTTGETPNASHFSKLKLLVPEDYLDSETDALSSALETMRHAALLEARRLNVSETLYQQLDDLFKSSEMADQLVDLIRPDELI